MQYINVIFILVFLSVSFACEKTRPTTGQDNPTINTTVKVLVKHVYQFQPDVKDSVVAGAEVSIFISALDRAQMINEEAKRTTDTSGYAIFEYRKHHYYYVLAKHPTLGTVEEEVSTPAGTVSFLEMLYY